MTQKKELSPIEQDKKRTKHRDGLFRGKYAIKRIIDGRTYNTDTSTIIALDWNGDEPENWALGRLPEYDVANALCKSRHGAYFLATFNAWLFEISDPKGETIKPLVPAEAQEWLETTFPESPDLIEAEFGEMPEAGHTESRFTLRMPDSLKRRIDTLSKVAGQSTNAWIIACLERCSAAQEPESKG